MDTAAPQLTDNSVNALLEQARQLILRLTAYIDSILERLGAAHPSNALLRKLTAYALVPAESALRRVVLILAAHQPFPERSARARAIPDAAKPRSAPRPPQAPRAPVFNMREPQPRPASDFLTPGEMPHIRLLTDDVLRAPAKALAPRDLSASFTRRLAALHAALNDPHAVAARWLRRHFAARVPKGCPLSPHRIPGHRKTLPEDDRNTLGSLTDLVLTYFATDTS